MRVMHAEFKFGESTLEWCNMTKGILYKSIKITDHFCSGLFPYYK